MIFKYRYNKLQEKLIAVLENTEIKFRVKRDRTIEFAKKWYPSVCDELCEIRFNIFIKPVIHEWSDEVDISEMLYELAQKNIPFLLEQHDSTYFIIYDDIDVQEIVDIEKKLGVNQLEY